MDKIQVNGVICQGKNVTVNFQVHGTVGRFFSGENFKVDYSIEVEDVPSGVAVIPFVCNVLPVVWLTDTVLEVPSLDRDFYKSIQAFKQGYENMYPMLPFNGKVVCDSICNNVLPPPPHTHTKL